MESSKYDLYYLLGFGFNNFATRDKELVLAKPRAYRQVVDQLALKVAKADWPAVRDGKAIMDIRDPDVVQFLCSHGAVTPKRYMPSVGDEYAWAFIAGYFDGYGSFHLHGEPRVSVSSAVPGVADFVASHWKVSAVRNRVTASGNRALDICGRMYHDLAVCNADWANGAWKSLNQRTDYDKLHSESFSYVKLSPSARPPQKSRVTDSGYDLHIIEMSRSYTTCFGATVYKAKTHLAVQPVVGQTFDVAGRSSLPDKGWMFMQGVGLCDRSYIGGVGATLMKLTDEPIPKLPWRAIQLVPRDAPVHANWREAKTFGDSDRQDNGFGSSGGH